MRTKFKVEIAVEILQNRLSLFLPLFLHHLKEKSIKLRNLVNQKYRKKAPKGRFYYLTLEIQETSTGSIKFRQLTWAFKQLNHEEDKF